MFLNKFCMKQKHKIFLIVTAILLVAFFIQSGKVKGKIICFGDSITYGASFEGNGWPEQLAKYDDEIKIVNAGKKGRKTSDRNELIPVIKANKDANYFLLLLGVNDLKDGNDSLVALCVDNMKWMISKVKEEIPEAKIILMSPCQISLENMTDLNKSKKYNENTFASLIKLEEEYRKLAEVESIGFISLLDTVSPVNLFDGIHPNISGYDEIANNIWDELSHPN